MNQKKMEKQEYKDEYTKRSSMERPFEIFKKQFQNRKRNNHQNDKNRKKRINLDA